MSSPAALTTLVFEGGGLVEVVIDTADGALMFSIQPEGASALAVDLEDTAASLKARHAKAETSTANYVPLAEIVDYAELPQTGELVITIRTENDALHHYRLDPASMLEFAKGLIASLTKLAPGEEPRH